MHDAAVHVEKTIPFPPAALSPARRLRHGRLDILIDLLGDYATVVEVKRHGVGSHSRSQPPSGSSRTFDQKQMRDYSSESSI